MVLIFSFVLRKLKQTKEFVFGLPELLKSLFVIHSLDIKPQNFWLHPKVMLRQPIYACIFVVGWSNQGKYYEIEAHFAKQDVET
jgi:hypothetical protein